MKNILKNIFSKKIEYSNFMFVGEFGDTQKELAELALRIGKENYGVSLDFSRSSIKLVDEILADIHKRYKEDGNEDGLFGISLEFGSYIAAIIQKEFELGVMFQNHPAMGDDTFPFIIENNAIFPCGWCEKRIYDGPGDDIESKFVVFLSKLNTSVNNENP